MMQFDLPKEKPSIIKVIGVGGGGSNAVNHMYRQGIRGVEFLVCNTDWQALETSPVPHKIQLGASLTDGRGAGSIPEVGKNSAIENLEDIRKALGDHTRMAFITAGMGGGTGTGAAPIIACVARELGILTVAIVTMPFAFEGKKRKQQAEAGIEELKKNVDTLLVICNDKLRQIHGNLKLAEAFMHADNVLTTAAKSIAEIISVTLHINVDFADVQTVMKESGVAIMGSAVASGENRAIRAVESALDSPLLNDSNIEGARYILLNITSGSDEISMDEMGDITDFIQQQAGQTAEVIMGVGTDESLGDKICVTIIATGFKTSTEVKKTAAEQRIVHHLNLQSREEIQMPVQTPAISPLEPVLKSDLTESSESFTESLVADEETVYVPETSDPVIFTLEEPTTTESETNEDSLQPEPEIIQQPESKTVFTLTEEIVAQEELPVTGINDSTEETSNAESSNIFTFEIKSETLANIETEQSMSLQAENKNETEPVAELDKPQAKDDSLNTIAEDPHEELFRRSRERILKLKEMSYRMQTPQGITDLEKEPAFKRRNIKLDNVPHSGDPAVSRFSLSEDPDKKVEIKPNSFLHDKVD